MTSKFRIGLGGFWGEGLRLHVDSRVKKLGSRPILEALFKYEIPTGL